MTTPLYDTLGAGYARVRAREPRIYARIARALGDAASVVNVGAGAGSYEPDDRWVLAVEPAQAMIAQRAARAAPCLVASAEHIPLADRAVDAVTAFLTIHHFTDLERGLSEMRRIARQRVVILTWLPSFARVPWMSDAYWPEVGVLDEARFPAIDRLERALGPVTVHTVPIPHDCVDGFYCAYWRRPRAYLDPDLRAGISSLQQIAPSVLDRGLGDLERDLDSGEWSRRFGALTSLDELDLGYRLVVADVR